MRTFLGKMWESGSFRRIVYFLAAVVLLVLAFCGAAYWKYRSVCRADPPVELLGKTEYRLPENRKNPVIFETVRATLRFRVPWNREPGEVTLKTPPGVQLTGEPLFEFDRYAWGANYWRITLDLQAYRDGLIRPGTVRVTFPGGREAAVFNEELPEFEAVLPAIGADDHLVSAGELPPEPEKRKSWLLTFGAAAVGLLILVLVFFTFRDFFRKRRADALPTVWELALEDVHRLREAVRTRALSPERATGELSNTVRRYLEERFSLRAEHQTTAEFLAELERDSSALADNDRRFLTKFLLAADMVKFARLNADADAFDGAAGLAVKLIQSSVPTPEVKK